MFPASQETKEAWVDVKVYLTKDRTYCLYLLFVKYPCRHFPAETPVLSAISSCLAFYIDFIIFKEKRDRDNYIYIEEMIFSRNGSLLKED